jgi:hypothetical protein
VHNVFFKFTGSSGLLFNFNWWKFTPLATGTGSAGGNSIERAHKIKVIRDAGKNTSLKLDFSERADYGNVNISLFDLSGRHVKTLFTGRLSSPHLELPLNRSDIRGSVYIVKVIVNDNVTLLSDKVKL